MATLVNPKDALAALLGVPPALAAPPDADASAAILATDPNAAQHTDVLADYLNPPSGTVVDTDNALENSDYMQRGQQLIDASDAQKVADAASQRKMAEAAVAPTIEGQNQLAVENVKAKIAETAAQAAAARQAQKETDAQTKANEPTNQIRTMAAYAGGATKLISTIEDELSDPDIASYVGSVTGRLIPMGNGEMSLPGDFAKAITADPALQTKLGQFGNDLTAAISAVARTHNQRGATKELIQEFGNNMRTSQPLNVLKGVLTSNHQLMQSYASMDPTLGYTNPYAPPDPMALTLGMPR